MWYNWVFILSLLWFSLSFTFYCLHKHEDNKISLSWFLFMAASWWQMLNAVENSEGCDDFRAVQMFIFYFRISLFIFGLNFLLAVYWTYLLTQPSKLLVAKGNCCRNCFPSKNYWRQKFAAKSFFFEV